MRKTNTKKISIVIPLYNEEENILNLYSDLNNQTEELNDYSWEYIFVNDGSEDNSFNILSEIAKNENNIKIIDLSKNFGKEIALTAGLDAVNSDAAIFMDADLQHPSNLIPELVKMWEEGNLVVSTVRKATEKQSIIRKLGSYSFYWFLNKFSETKITPNTTDYKILDKKVIDILKVFTERNRMFRGLVDWIGYKTEYVEFVDPERVNGKARYSFRKLVSLAVNSLTSFIGPVLHLFSEIRFSIPVFNQFLFLI